MRKIIVLLVMMFVCSIPFQLLACGKNKVHKISMERTPCMGKCPWYKVEITESGLVKYWGKKFAPRQGYYEGTISESNAKALMRKFSRKKIHKAQKEYSSNISDVPMMHFTFNLGKENAFKKVRQANFGPSYFTSLGKELDAVLAGVAWKQATDNDNE